MRVVEQFESPPLPSSDDEMVLFREGLLLLSQLLTDDKEFLEPSKYSLFTDPEAIAERLQVYGVLLQHELKMRDQSGDGAEVSAVKLLRL
jgi:hypothetical protein